jgi:hypothetical protein
LPIQEVMVIKTGSIISNPMGYVDSICGETKTTQYGKPTKRKLKPSRS